MSGTLPSARSMRHVLGVLERLPLEVLGMVVERVIGRLDAAEDTDCDHDGCDDGPLWAHLVLSNGAGDLDDAEPDDGDCCAAGECGGRLSATDHLPGDPEDVEDDDPQGDNRHDPDIEEDGAHQPYGQLGTDPVTGPAECGPQNFPAPGSSVLSAAGAKPPPTKPPKPKPSERA